MRPLKAEALGPVSVLQTGAVASGIVPSMSSLGRDLLEHRLVWICHDPRTCEACWGLRAGYALIAVLVLAVIALTA